MDRYAGTSRDDDAEIEPDVVPQDAPRGGITVPTANDTGMTTPPVSGWGDTVREAADDEADAAEQPADAPDE